MKLHTRTCRRALDKITVLRANAIHPVIIQRYLIGWAAWWLWANGMSAGELLSYMWRDAFLRSPQMDFFSLSTIFLVYVASFLFCIMTLRCPVPSTYTTPSASTLYETDT